MDSHVFLQQALVILAGIVVAVPVFMRLKLGAVLGYLVVGVAVGPQAMAIVTDVEAIQAYSEFGVVMLLFIIGLELNPRRLWQMRRPIVGTGGAQVVFTAILVFGAARASGLDWRAAVVIAMGFALSSTAIALAILGERREMATPGGVQAFSVLLFQDLAVIPMLAVLPLLSPIDLLNTDHGSSLGGWWSIAKVLCAVLILVGGGRILARPLFRLVASAHSREAFTAFALLLVIGAALLMHAVGMSMAMGTFLAGVLLAESEFRHELEVDLEPFKGLLLGLFFMSVGMSLDLTAIAARPWAVVGITLAVVAAKFGVLLSIARVLRLESGQALSFAAVMAQVGEFAFVLFKLGQESAILTPADAALAKAAVAASMFLTPVIVLAIDRMVLPRLRGTGANRTFDLVEDQGGGVIIAGFGRFGQVVGRLLHAHRIDATILDHDPGTIELLRKFGWKVFYGDATRVDLLTLAGAARAKILVIAVDEPATAIAIVKNAREHFPNLEVLARVRNRQHAFDMLELGVRDPVRETIDSALTLSEQVLGRLGYPAYRARRAAQRFRMHDEQGLREMAKIRIDDDDGKGVVNFAAEAREQLKRLMARDSADLDEIRGSGWG